MGKHDVIIYCIINTHLDRDLSQILFQVCVQNNTIKQWNYYLLQLSQDTWVQPQGYPLQRPLTPLEPEDARTALDIYKLVCKSDSLFKDSHGHKFTLVSSY